MKILTNTQNYMVGGIPRIIKNMILDGDTVFRDMEFITINLEKENLKHVKIAKFQRNDHHISVEGYYDRSLFSENLSTYTSMSEIESDFQELIGIFQNLILEECPQLIIVNGTGIIPWALMKASESHKIPVIIYYHGSITEEEKSDITKGKASILHAFEKSFLKKEYGYIFPSLLLKTMICERFSLDPDSIFHRIVPNSVPLYFFHAPKPPIIDALKSPAIRIGFIMRWCNVKNKEFVIRFIQHIQSTGLEHIVHLITDKDESVIRAIGNTKSLVIHEPLKHKELGIFLRNEVDIVLCPSRFETYGNIAQEAIAVGTPAMVHMNMGVAETFEKIGLSHCVIDFDNTPIPDIIEAIQSLLTTGIPKESIQILKDEYGSHAINYRRLDFFMEYMTHFAR